MTPCHTRKVRWTFAAALAVFGAILFSVARTESADAPAPQKTLLDKPVPGVRADKPIAADALIEHLQDSTSLTITVDWDKLGTRGDKGVTVNIGPMPLRDHINAILKAAGTTKKAQMTVNGTKVHVTAAPEEGKK